MGLMTGTGPFGREPAGTFNAERTLHLEPTPKRVRVIVGGKTIADSRRAMMLHESGHQPVYYFPPDDTTRAVALFETNLPPRWYLPREDVVAELEPSDTVTRCPYKGTASYHSASGQRDLIWCYADPLPEVGRIAGLLAFFNERVDL